MHTPTSISILLIEDNPGDRRLLQETLREADALAPTAAQHRLHTADRLDRGLEAIGATQPDLVLLDLSLPDSSGLATLIDLVATAPHIAVVILTGLDDKELAIRALQSGAQDYLIKGEIGPSLLRRVIPYAIERKRGEIALRESERFARATVDSLSAHIAILDADGTIIAVNQAWRSFSELNDGDPGTTGVGLSYLEVCDHAIGADAAEAQAAIIGIREVQSRCKALFELEYACHEPKRQRWFRMRVFPFAGDGPQRVVVAHEEITERKLAEARLERKVGHLAALRSIDIAIAAGHNLAQTLEVCVEQVIQQLGVLSAGILVHNPNTQALDYAAGRGPETTTALQVHLQVGAGLAAQAIRERRAILSDLRDAQLLGLTAQGGYCCMAVPLVAKDSVEGVLELIIAERAPRDDDWEITMEALAGQVAIAIDSAGLYESLQSSNRDLAHAYDATIEGWSRALDLRDKETEGHSRRVTELTLRLARAAGLAEAEIVHVRRGALLHDIGKMGIPDQILLKPDRLTEEEWVVMRRHPQLAVDLLTPIRYLHPALDIPYCHHERWDGSGYPRGLRGEQIPLVARLFAVVDVWDALRSDRPYRRAWAESEVRAHIQSLAGSHFDPAAVELFLAMIDEGA